MSEGLCLLHRPSEGDPLGQFAIIQQSEGGWGLILKEPLDREVRDRHTLRVMATDGKFEASVSVDVHVLDINDNSPQCEQVREPPGHVTRRPSAQGSEMAPSSRSRWAPLGSIDLRWKEVLMVLVLLQLGYSEVLMENSPSSSFVLKVSAVDPDAGANGQVSYSLHGPDADRFHLDQRTGTMGCQGSHGRRTVTPVDLHVLRCHFLLGQLTTCA